uniref:TetR/AcrR family transcriptional regulator n=1 Tax=Burkholderia sp. AU33423 TaxID=2015355 RepID=UPI00211B0D20|nr:TetR/AcrR family transcriptional regulator [Burkholderia sp. AU33423]
MGIGRQRLSAAFGDKWQLDLSARRRYGTGECAAHFDALRSGARAIDGIDALLRHVVEMAAQSCLRTISIYEFGAPRPELTDIHAVLAHRLIAAIAGRVRDAQREGGVAAEFLIASINGMRIAGRGDADRASLSV